MADHNDPNAVNSIFSDIDVSATDLYDLFGFPSPNTDGGEKVVIALTFASIPSTGVFDTDMLYRLLVSPDPRVVGVSKDEHTLKGSTRPPLQTVNASGIWKVCRTQSKSKKLPQCIGDLETISPVPTYLSKERLPCPEEKPRF